MTTQLDCAVGIKKETTYGTAVTVDHFFEDAGAAFKWQPTFLDGQGLHVGSRFDRSARHSVGRQMITGDWPFEAGSKTLGIILEAAFGTAAATTQRASTGVYQQNFTPTTTDYLNSYTIQVGIPELGGGAADPTTLRGMVCTRIEFDCPNGDIVAIKTSWVGKDYTNGTSLATPSYATPIELLTFVMGSITLGGSPTPPSTTAFATGGTAASNVRDFNVVIDNNVDDGGFNFGGAGKRVRKPALGKSTLTGQFTAEYDGTTFRDAYLAQTAIPVVLSFVGASNIGSGTDNPGLSLYIPDIRIVDGGLPNSNGGSVVAPGLAFKGFDNLSAAPITVSYASTDATA